MDRKNSIFKMINKTNKILNEDYDDIVENFA